MPAQDGNFLDRYTRRLTAQMLTFSAQLRGLVYTRLTFEWSRDGACRLRRSACRQLVRRARQHSCKEPAPAHLSRLPMP
jgi:hypothetical protein